MLTVLVVSPLAIARQPRAGYRGFLEWSSSVRNETFAEYSVAGNKYTYRDNTFFTGFSTSHGYQIDPMFFVGAGIGAEHCSDYDNWIVPLFIEGRIDLEFGRFTPFFDVRLGANFGEGVGVYFSPTIGYRFNWGRKVGINIGAGLTVAGYKVECYQGTWLGPDSYEIYYVGTKHRSRAYFTFRVGIDF